MGCLKDKRGGGPSRPGHQLTYRETKSQENTAGRGDEAAERVVVALVGGEVDSLAGSPLLPPEGEAEGDAAEGRVQDRRGKGA